VIYCSGTLHYNVSYIRKITRRNKNGDIKVYYAEVESVRVGGKVMQRHIRSLGTNPSSPTNFPIGSTLKIPQFFIHSSGILTES